MMKRNRIILMIFGLVGIVACLALGWVLFSASAEKKIAYDKRNQSFTAVKRIFDADVFPDEKNIARTKANRVELEGWLLNASNQLHKGDLPQESLSPTAFKQILQASVRKLSRQPGMNKGKVVAPDFNFGFEKYLGENRLPESENVTRLTAQLRIIETICKELYAAKIDTLESIQREVFENAEADNGSSKKKKYSRHDKKRPVKDKKNKSSTPDYFKKQRFEFEYTASASAFAQALNNLASTDLFIVVTESSFTKTGDQLLKLTAGSSKDDDGEKKSPALMSPAERMITNPDLNPPVRVKLITDVYSFKGV